MKKFAFIEYGGYVISIENRCSHFYKKDCEEWELSIEDIVHPNLINRYVEIPDGIYVEEGMIYSNGEFKVNPKTESNAKAEAIYRGVEKGVKNI